MTARIDTDGEIVSLYLQISESERQTIIQYGLDQVVFEEYPEFDKADIIQFKVDDDERIAAIHGYSEQKIFEREISKQAQGDVMKQMRAARIQVRLIDYMAYPYTRYFKTKHEATQYAAKLKQSLPKIKEMVDLHANHQTSETIQL
jgi:hypothetical protein